MTTIGMLSRLSADAALLRGRMEVLTRQVASGQRGDALGDLSPALPRALDLKAEIGRRDLYGKAVEQALGRAAAMQQALSRLTAIARDFADTVAMRLDPNDPQGVTFAATKARSAMAEVAGLLNSRHAGEYLFGGSDLANPPVPDAANIAGGGMATQIATAITGLGGGNAAAVGAATRAAAQSDAAGITPFSAFLSDPAAGLAEPRRGVPAGEGEVIPYGIAANRNAAATSAGETTGGWARDLLRGLASIAALGPAQAAQPQDFNALRDIIRNGLKSAETALSDEAGALGDTEARLEATRRRQSDLSDVLQQQVADIQEVDLATTITKLQATQAALQASYAATGRLAGLSLVNFLR